MTSFQLSVTPHRRVAARFVSSVRRRLQKAFADAPDIKQTDIAKALGVHRSVINRQLRGYQDMTLGRVAELSWALGQEPTFDLLPAGQQGCINSRGELPSFSTEVGSTGTEQHISLERRVVTAAI